MWGKGLWQTIRSSFYDPAFYAGVRTQPLRPAIKILSVLGFIGIAISMVGLMAVVIPFSQTDFPTKVEAAYPDGLVVKVSGGEMTVNRTQPFTIENTIFSGGPKNLIIFDGNDTLAADLQANDTVAIAQKKNLIMEGQNHQQQIIPYSRLGTTTIDKSTVVGVVEKVRPYFAPVVMGGGAALALLMILFGTLFWVFFHMLYVLFPALVIFLLSMAFKNRMPYREAYMVTLYASIPVAIIFYLVAFLGVPQLQFVYTLLVVLFAIINNRKKPV